MGLRPVQPDDLRYFVAAYRAGSFQTLTGQLKAAGAEIPDRPTAEQIGSILDAAFGPYVAVVLEARNFAGRMPVGVVVEEHRPAWIEPVVYWFPWTTARNKIEAALKYLSDLKDKSVEAIVFGHMEHNEFWFAMCRYGVLKDIGSFLVGGIAMRAWQVKLRVWQGRR